MRVAPYSGWPRMVTLTLESPSPSGPTTRPVIPATATTSRVPGATPVCTSGSVSNKNESES
ncbi:MAG: hypothetical protein IPG04_35380 [Polyangiaceae bacterium]|nr:hypothetical protein [Polyangiaceae bacterium]